MFLFVEGVFGETVSEGKPITLRTGLTEIQKGDVIDWRFGAEYILIARVRTDSNPTTYEDALEGKFRGRLQLNGQTGDLTITNIKTTDAGDYEVSNSINTFKKTLTVNVRSGPSSGAAAGIASAVVLLVAAAAAVIATR